MMTTTDNRYFVTRIHDKYAYKAVRTLYSKCERVKDKYLPRTYSYVTTLYADEQCTQIAYTLSRGARRIMKSGVFRLFNVFQTFVQIVRIVCVDTGVRREATNRIKYEYHYDK
jgi:hypothetical protein